MKIITENKAYVQLNDLAYLMKSSEGKSIPSSIINKVFKDMFICTDSNRYEFMEFDSPEEIKFFKDLEYSVDYMECINLSDVEIIEKGQEIADEMNKVAKKYNDLSDEDKEKNQRLVVEHELLQFKMYSLRDIIWFRQGKLKMKLPKLPEMKATRNIDAKGVRKILNKILKR